MKEVGAPMKYVRIYADAAGRSHFEDVQVAMSPVPSTNGVRSRTGSSMPIGGVLTFTNSVVEGAGLDNEDTPPGEWGPWRRTETAPHFVLWIEGQIDIEVSDGEVRRVGRGEMVLVEDETGDGHRTRKVSASAWTISIPLAPD
jgi:hypothetical protein